MNALIPILLLAVATTSVSKPSAPTAQHFAFLFETGWGTKLDTYHDTLTKDLVADPDTTIQFVLSQADLDSVRQKMIAIHFFDLPEPHPPFGECQGTMSPNSSTHWMATLGSRTEQLSWDGGEFGCENFSSPEWKGLFALQELIWRIIQRQPAYQALPHPKGAYL